MLKSEIINKIHRNNYTPHKSAKWISEDKKSAKMQKDAYKHESDREDKAPLVSDMTLDMESECEKIISKMDKL